MRQAFVETLDLEGFISEALIPSAFLVVEAPAWGEVGVLSAAEPGIVRSTLALQLGGIWNLLPPAGGHRRLSKQKSWAHR